MTKADESTKQLCKSLVERLARLIKVKSSEDRVLCLIDVMETMDVIAPGWDVGIEYDPWPFTEERS